MITKEESTAPVAGAYSRKRGGGRVGEAWLSRDDGWGLPSRDDLIVWESTQADQRESVNEWVVERL